MFLLVVSSAFGKVCVIYGVSLQKIAAPTEKEEGDKQEDEFMWAFQGELDTGFSYPKVVKIPKEALETQPLFYPDGARFNAKRRGTKLTNAVWVLASNVSKEIGLPSMIPVSPCLVYNTFEKDIDALIIYKRWMAMREEVS